MNSATIAVHWHDETQPVYSVNFQPTKAGIKSKRLATAGGDNNVRIWRVDPSNQNPEESSVEYLSTLRKHTQAVNVVRFDPKGETLATAGDDGSLILWSLADSIVVEFGHQDDDVKESWVVKHVHSSNSEIYDLCWSEDSKYIATGSMDNTLKIFSAATGQKLLEIGDHSHYVQGVAWDPLNEYVATQSADRSVHVYKLGSTDKSEDQLKLSPFSKISRVELIPSKASTILAHKGTMKDQKETISITTSVPFSSPAASPLKGTDSGIKKSSSLYQSETLQSFFRRLAFSPDGSLLLTPSGIFKHEDPTFVDARASGTDSAPETTSLNTVYIYTRSGLNRAPICHLPGLNKASVAISFNPLKYELTNGIEPVFRLDYKMVFAVATHDSVIIYDTQHLQPLGASSNLHYLTITDLSWDRDGQSIIVSSAEGFCSVITFDDGVFGKVYGPKSEDDDLVEEISPPNATSPEKPFVMTLNQPNQISNPIKSQVSSPATSTSSKPDILTTGNTAFQAKTLGIKSDISQTLAAPDVQQSFQPPSTATSVTQNLLSQFMANPIGTLQSEPVVSEPSEVEFISERKISEPDTASGTEAGTSSAKSREDSRPDINDRPKKKRIAPTLIQTTK